MIMIRNTALSRRVAFAACALVGGFAAASGVQAAVQGSEQRFVGAVQDFVSAPARGAVVAPTKADETQLAGHIPAFSRNFAASDAPPVRLVSPASVTRRAAGSGFRLVTQSTDGPVFAAAVDGGVCVSSAINAESICVPEAVLPDSDKEGALGALQTTMCGPGVDPADLLLHGFIPSSIKTLTVTRTDGSRESVPTPDGFVHFRFSKSLAPVAAISWTAGDGTKVSVPSPFPPDASESCAGTR